jgi:hypothetical protein
MPRDRSAGAERIISSGASAGVEAQPMLPSTQNTPKRVRSSSPLNPIHSASALTSVPSPLNASAAKSEAKDDVASRASSRAVSSFASRRTNDFSAIRDTSSAAIPPLCRSMSSDSYFVTAVSCDPSISLLLTHSPRCAESILCDDAVLSALSEGSSPKYQSLNSRQEKPKALSRLKVPAPCMASADPL